MTGGERLLGAGLAGLLLLATLGEGGGSPTSLLVWHGVLVVLSVVVLVATGGARRRTVAGSVVTAFGLFALLFAVGAARASYGFAAFLVALELGACALAAWLAAVPGPALLELIVWPLRCGAALQGLYGIVQWGLMDRPRPTGTFLNTNHFALWLLAVTLLSLGAWSRSLAGRLLVVACALPATAALLLTGSRGALLALAVGGGWLLAVRWRRLPRAARLVTAAGLLLVAVLFGIRLVQRLGDSDPFRYQRLRIWRASLALVAEEPVWGSGPGQFSTAAANLAFPDGDGPLRYDRTFSASHSDLIRLPAELGIPAALALLAALGLGARRLVRLRGEDRASPEVDGALAALLAVGTQALVDNPSRWSSIYVLASVVTGCLLAVPVSHPRGGLGLRTRTGLAALLLVLFGVGDVAPYLAWERVQGLPRGRLDEGQARRLRRALDLNPIHPDYWLRLAEHIAGDGIDWDPDAYGVAREAAERAVRLHDEGARYHRGLARLEALACRTLFPDEATRDRARTHYLDAERLARFDPFTPIGLAAFLIDTGDPAGARRAAERALALEPDSVLPRLLLADAFIESGAARDLERAAALLGEARDRAERAPGSLEGPYAIRLMHPDPGVLERLEGKLRGAAPSPAQAGVRP